MCRKKAAPIKQKVRKPETPLDLLLFWREKIKFFTVCCGVCCCDPSSFSVCCNDYVIAASQLLNLLLGQ